MGYLTNQININRKGLKHVRSYGFALLDVLMAGILLGIALSVIIGLSSQALQVQIQGEKMEKAAMLLDELLNEVLAVGVEEYPNLFDSEGERDVYPGYTYKVEIEEAQLGHPYRITATVWWESSGTTKSEVVQTYIAPRLGDEQMGDRMPENIVDRTSDGSTGL